MPTPCKHKTVQARILANAEAIGLAVVSRQKGSCFSTKQAVAAPNAANAVVNR